mmetsp:Transcript_53475/g.126504  ORF Transcript_53475/g.126504 Transcript_53475/m.126504 type:complete len:214 (+) Transcript_53475:302-943(+)
MSLDWSYRALFAKTCTVPAACPPTHRVCALGHAARCTLLLPPPRCCCCCCCCCCSSSSSSAFSCGTGAQVPESGSGTRPARCAPQMPIWLAWGSTTLKSAWAAPTSVAYLARSCSSSLSRFAYFWSSSAYLPRSDSFSSRRASCWILRDSSSRSSAWRCFSTMWYCFLRSSCCASSTASRERRSSSSRVSVRIRAFAASSCLRRSSISSCVAL